MGKWSNFDLLIFFTWVGEKPPTSYYIYIGYLLGMSVYPLLLGSLGGVQTEHHPFVHPSCRCNDKGAVLFAPFHWRLVVSVYVWRLGPLGRMLTLLVYIVRICIICIYVYVYVYLYVYVTYILCTYINNILYIYICSFQTFKIWALPLKTRVIWVPGVYVCPKQPGRTHTKFFWSCVVGDLFVFYPSESPKTLCFVIFPNCGTIKSPIFVVDFIEGSGGP